MFSFFKRRIENLKQDERFNVKDIENELAHERRMKELLRLENDNLKKGLLIVQKNLADTLAANKEPLESAEATLENLKSVDNENKINITELTSLTENIKRFYAHFENFSFQVKDISGVISKVSEIAFQLNILSLNASIEAARAGDENKAFRTVAEEMHRLSTGTTDSAAIILEKTKELNYSFSELISEVERIEKNSSTVRDRVVSHGEVVTETINKNFNFISSIIGNNNNFFTALAKLDHIIWKLNTYLSVLGEKPSFTFVDHRNCRLGKWYMEGEGRKHFSHTSSYQKMNRPHSNVHQDTKDIFSYLDSVQDNFGKIEVLIRDMEKNSEDVFEILDHMTLEVNSGLKISRRTS